MKKRRVIRRKISYIIIFILLGIDMTLFFNYLKKNSKEIIDENLFTDYYEASVVDNGGVVLLDEFFNSFTRHYELKESEEKLPKEKKVEINNYKVQNGDTLSKIAKKFGINSDTIKMNNFDNKNVQNGKLKVGETLSIPNVDGVYYTIKKNEYLTHIANKFNISVKDITDYNDINPKKIKQGMKIFLRGVKFEKFKEVNTPKKIKVKTKKIKDKTGKVIETKIVDENSAEIGSSSSGFAFPVRYAGVSSKFGNRFHPVLKKYVLHTGVDLIAKFVPLRAARSGVVTFAGYMSGYGKIIIIKHDNGYETRYAHLSVISTKVGERVNQGDLIGKTGNSGRVTGPHLHFEIRINGVPKNPMNYLR